MFETVELGQAVDKRTYKEQVPIVRTRLLELQHRLKQADFAVVIVIAGVEGAGKSETVKVLHEWLDPRFIETHGFVRLREEEREHPPFWRFWRALPPSGKIGVFFNSWYTEPIIARTFRETNDSDVIKSMDRIIAFERALAVDGTLLVKFWFHLSKAAQKKRLEKLAKNPEQSWRVTKRDWRFLDSYDRFRKVSERALGLTGTPQAPWTLVEGTDKRFRNLRVAEHLRAELEQALTTNPSNRGASVAPATSWGESEGQQFLEGQQRSSGRQPPEGQQPSEGQQSLQARTGASAAVRKNVLSSVDLGKVVDRRTYQEELHALQEQFGRLCRKLDKNKRSAVFVFEGWDAAGKGGVIRRVAAAMDARHYGIVPVAAPTDEEKARHYLWRFWRRLPREGRVTIFDRSWYGRVLVERVENYARPPEWSRAYREINEFERELTEHGVIVHKFWLHIDREEQLRRFREREQVPWKRFKITEEDWRNREKWGSYELAVHEMVERTSTVDAPWTLVSSNDKRYARLTTLRALCGQMKRELENKPRN